MAKKKTGSRKTASRGARKGARKTAGTRARAAAPTRAAMPHISATLDEKKRTSEVTWKAGPNKINLTPLKAILQAHIDRLSRYPQIDDVPRTLEVLRRAKAELQSICGFTMEIPVPPGTQL